MRKKTFFSIFFLSITALFFLIFKILNLEIRLSDTNVYFLTSYHLLNGKLLYKDIFFTNFPLFPYVSILYILIVNQNLPWFYLTSSIEAIAIFFLIYFIVFKKIGDHMISIVSSLLYLFSFIVLSTSDHQTGVFTASLFAVLSYFFLEKKSYLFSGFFSSLAFLTKAYFVPIPLAFILFIIKTDSKKSIYFLLSFITTLIIILAPFLIFSKVDMLKDLFSYSLNRETGIPKKEIISFFITHDFVLFSILIFNLFNFKKNLLFSLMSFFGIIFFFYYQDIYYLYLNFFVPFLAISFYHPLKLITSKFSLEKRAIFSFLLIIFTINFSLYFIKYKDLQKINNSNEIVEIINKEKPKYLYGVSDLTPALSYLTKTPLVEDIIDTNENIFRKKILDKKLLTKKAVEKNSIIVSHGADYSYLGINELVLDNVFDKEIIMKSCSLISTFPVKAEGIINRINLFKCF